MSSYFLGRAGFLVATRLVSALFRARNGETSLLAKELAPPMSTVGIIRRNCGVHDPLYGDSVFGGKRAARFVFWRKPLSAIGHRDHLALDGSPRRIDVPCCAGQFLAMCRPATNAECRGFVEQDPLQL